MNKSIAVSEQLNRDDFSVLYTEKAPGFLKYLLASGMPHAAAEDVIQDSFLELWKEREKIHSRDAMPSFWFAILRHRMIDSFRRMKKTCALPPDADRIAAPEKTQDDSDTDYLRHRIASALDSLPPELAECYKMAKISGMPLRDVAEVQHISEAAVKTRIFRARQKLMEMLADVREKM